MRPCFFCPLALNPAVQQPFAITAEAARRFVRRALGFDEPFETVSEALAHHGYIQIDPINICGRMHDLILRNRVKQYREGDLMRLLHGDPAGPPLPPTARVAFEHHLPDSGNLVAFPLDAWPHLLGAMRSRTRRAGAWSGRLTPREKALAAHLLAEIAARGPLGAEDFDDARKARQVWGASKLVKSTLQKLFFHGRLLIAQRVNHRRRYDLPERVLPAPVLAQVEPTPAETARWLALLKLRQRRLVTLKREELRLITDAVLPLAITGLPNGSACPPLFCLRDDAPRLEAAAAAPADSHASSVVFVAPLDPLIYDRKLTAALWQFDYTWEAYTPPAKRVRGYYALPVLVGTEFVGHVAPKADREARKLVVVSRRIQRGHAVAPGLKDLAEWLGFRR